MFPPTSTSSTLFRDIIDRVEDLIVDAETNSKPLELDPLRGQLFEMFVTAEGAGYLRDDSDPNLTADALCHELADRWGLAEVMRSSLESQRKLPAESLAKMRLLWSVMRMWMEWTYAWDRWPEFHQG